MIDPLADKLLLTASFVTSAVTTMRSRPGWLLVVGRDVVIVAGAVVYHNLIGRVTAEPTRLSKFTTFVQIVFVLATLLHLSRWRSGRPTTPPCCGWWWRRPWPAASTTSGVGRCAPGAGAGARAVIAEKLATSTERWQWLVLVLLLGGLLYLLAPVLTPFATAALLAYLGDPLVDRLERWRLSRDAAVSVVFAGWLLLLVGVLLLLVPFTERQISNFLAQLPHWIEWFQTTAAPWLAEHLDISLTCRTRSA